jgi:hypothetical protein
MTPQANAGGANQITQLFGGAAHGVVAALELIG